MRRLTLHDDVMTYVVQVPDNTEIKLGWHGLDWLGVICPYPDPETPDELLWLGAHFLSAAIRESLFGIRLISETPIGASQDGEPVLEDKNGSRPRTGATIPIA